MGNYLKLFKNHAQYEQYKTEGNELPSVAYCIAETEMHIEPLDYSKQYLTTVALEDGTITFRIPSSISQGYVHTVSYSLDDGENWVTTENVSYQDVIIDVNVNRGNKVIWRGTANFYALQSGASCGFGNTRIPFNVEGNIMSMLYGVNFKNQTNLPSANYIFSNFFRGTNIISAKNLILPATELKNSCYEGMFASCNRLTVAPQLLAATLAQDCYNNMFEGCSSLTTAPTLSAATLAEGCYANMFNRCISLTTAPTLSAATLQPNCYQAMFSYCTRLTTVPQLPSGTLANECYLSMFAYCTSLTAAPTLSATTLARSCYSFMFLGCTSLATAPILNATTLQPYCYQGMFEGCTSLTTAPKLPATTLVEKCYDRMFYECSSLNKIEASFTTKPSTEFSINWVNGVSSSGTFYRNTYGSPSWEVTGVNGIPVGWDIRTINLGPNMWRTTMNDGTSNDIQLAQGQTAITSGDTSHIDYQLTVKVEFGSYVKEISENAFSGITGIETAIINGSIETVKSQAFYDCTNLSKVVISNSVRNIKVAAFGNCRNLSEVYVYSPTPPTLESSGANPFTGSSNFTIYVPNGYKDTYTNAWGYILQNQDVTFDVF